MTMLSVVVAAALMPMPRSVEMRGGTVAATGEVRIVESRDAAIAAEGYRIEIDGSGVKVSASDAAGFFRARTTGSSPRTGAGHAAGSRTRRRFRGAG